MKESEDFASDIAFEAADDLWLAHSFLRSARHIVRRPLVVAEPDEDDPMESCVGLTVATTVEPVPIGLAGGSRQRTDSTESGEGGLRAKAFSVAPCGDEEGGCRIRPYAEGIDQGWR